jgi:hypothetical protein
VLLSQLGLCQSCCLLPMQPVQQLLHLLLWLLLLQSQQLLLH